MRRFSAQKEKYTQRTDKTAFCFCSIFARTTSSGFHGGVFSRTWERQITLAAPTSPPSSSSCRRNIATWVKLFFYFLFALSTIAGTEVVRRAKKTSFRFIFPFISPLLSLSLHSFRSARSEFLAADRRQSRKPIAPRAKRSTSAGSYPTSRITLKISAEEL